MGTSMQREMDTLALRHECMEVSSAIWHGAGELRDRKRIRQPPCSDAGAGPGESIRRKTWLWNPETDPSTAQTSVQFCHPLGRIGSVVQRPRPVLRRGRNCSVPGTDGRRNCALPPGDAAGTRPCGKSGRKRCGPCAGSAGRAGRCRVAHPDHGGIGQIRASGEESGTDIFGLQMVDVRKSGLAQIAGEGVRVEA